MRAVAGIQYSQATVVQPGAWLHVVNAGTVVGRTAAGALRGVNVNSVAAPSTATIYDAASVASLSGTAEIGVLTLGAALAMPIYLQLGSDPAGLQLNNGYVIVTTGTCDLTFNSI